MATNDSSGDHVEGRPDLALNEVSVWRARQVGVAERNHRKPDFDRQTVACCSQEDFDCRVGCNFVRQQFAASEEEERGRERGAPHGMPTDLAANN
jgi:hypothetical protein